MSRIEAIREKFRDEDPYVRRDACEAVGEIRAGDYIPELIPMLRDSHPGVREAALNALTTIGGRPVADAIVPLLRLEDAALRNIGIEVLAQIGVNALETIYSLLNDPDDDIVKFAVDILAGLGEESAVNALCPILKHENPNVRASVAVCLGKIRAGISVPMLLEALRTEDDEWVRFSIIEGLGHMHDKNALDPLLDMIESGSGLIREAAIEAVSRLAETRDAADVLTRIEALLETGRIMNCPAVVDLTEKALSPGSKFRPSIDSKKKYLKYFTAVMADAETHVKLKALRGIGLLKMEEGLTEVFKFANSLKEIDDETEFLLVDTVVQAVGSGHIPAIIRKELERRGKSMKVIVRALGEIRSEEAVPLLLGLLNRVSPHELRDIVSALEAIGSADSVGALFELIKSNDGHTRKAAARALGTLAGPSAAASLFTALKTEVYRDVFEEITNVLALIPSEEVKEGFSELLNEESEMLREMGAKGLGLTGDERALEPLIKASKDRSPNVRKSAYNAMAKLGIPEAIDIVVKGLKDSSDEVKLSVLKALGGWSGEKIMTALTEALKDRNIWVRYHSVLLLGEFSGSGAEKLILEMLVKDEAPVKAAAARSLSRLGSAEAIKVLEQFIYHPDPSVRVAVENAIESIKC